MISVGKRDSLSWISPAAMVTRQRFLAISVFVLIVLAGFAFRNPGRQSPRWTAPYFSAAANFQFRQGFYIDVEDIRRHSQLNDFDAERQYRFRRSNELSAYNHNPIGYVYVIMLASAIFGWWFGDIESLLILQILVHAATTVFVMTQLKSRSARAAFVLAYGINPLIIHFVTLDYYYFWQVVPSLALIAIGYRKERRSRVAWIFWGAVLGGILTIRPTTGLVVALIHFGLWKRDSWRLSLLSLTACLSVFLFLSHSHSKNIWHTLYIGVGAYSNPYIKGLTDANGYRLMEAKTGLKLDIEVGGNYYIDSIVDRYREVTRSEYLRILSESPLILIKHALINVLASFSVGYAYAMGDGVNYGIALSGLVLLGLLFRLREYWMILAIGISSIGFAPYYPPVQAYMFGSFILLSFVAAKIGFDEGRVSRVLRKLTPR